MGDVTDKLAYFQAITGIDDRQLCREILTACDWNLEQAISTYTETFGSSEFRGSVTTEAGASSAGATSNPDDVNDRFRQEIEIAAPAAPATGGPQGLAWKLVTLPFSIISGSLGLLSGAIGLGMWAAGGVLSYSLGMIGLNAGRVGGASTTPLTTVSAAMTEARDFVESFERDFGDRRPNFVAEGFMDALQRSRHDYKLLFVYIHSPEHPDTPIFCERTLCNDVLAAFINENFVAWGGNIRASEGFKMSNSLKASRFPFCAVVMAATNQRIALLQQVYLLNLVFLFQAREAVALCSQLTPPTIEKYTHTKLADKPKCKEQCFWDYLI